MMLCRLNAVMTSTYMRCNVALRVSMSTQADTSNSGETKVTGSTREPWKYYENDKTVALIFPGQGSQYVGMGKELYKQSTAARDAFDEVDEALQFKLTDLMFHGDRRLLMETENAQPAILAHSIALLRVLEMEFRLPPQNYFSCTLGHSLGQYSSLVASKMLSLSVAASLTHLRGKLMKNAASKAHIPTGMAAITPISPEQVQSLIEEVKQHLVDPDVCELAAINSPKQSVISGSMKAIEQAARIARENFRARAQRINVSAPFHCSLMHGAQQEFAMELSATDFFSPLIPIICNVTGLTLQHRDDVIDSLVEQITSPVLWYPSVQYARQNSVDYYVELGPGSVLGDLVKQSIPDAHVRSISTYDDLVEFFTPVVTQRDEQDAANISASRKKKRRFFKSF